MNIPLPSPAPPRSELGNLPGASPLPADGELRFLDLFERAGDLILIVDPAGRVLFANQAWREALGYEGREIPGLSIFDVTRRADHAVCEAWLSQSAQESARTDVRIVFQARDGREVPVEGFTSARVEDRRVLFLRGFFRDMSREKRAEAALQENAELFNLLISHTLLGVFRTDASGRLTYTSAQWRRIAGLTHSTQPKGVWWQMVHPQDRERVLAEWQSALRLSHEFSAEFRIQSAHPVERWCRTRISHHCGPDAAVRGGIGTAEDITEQRRAALTLRRAHNELEDRVRARTAELEAANRELAEFAYVVSHDLKAPLRGVSLLSEWLAQDYSRQLGPEGIALCDKLRQRVQEMHALVDGVLEYARIGHTQEDEVTVNTGHVVHGVIQSLATPEGVQFEVSSSLPLVRGQPQQLKQVFQNLLDNAVKFIGRPDGRIAVDAQRQTAGWEFTVRDNGPGIHPRHHQRIFQIFQRLDPKSPIAGAGIGLSLVKRIIESRGGRITVESEEGSGAVFRFTWPDEPRARGSAV